MVNAINLNGINTKDTTFQDKILNIKNLSFKFDDKIIFDNISFSIETGDFACIVGKNGCGKSTLLKLILNLIKNPSSSIEINTKYVSYIPQSINLNKDFPITIKEFLKFNCKELEVSFSYALSLCEKYNIYKCMNSLIGKLSGGELQKLMLVRALLKKTDLLIVDEPTNNLDEESKKIIYENLKELNKENITILVVEHNKDFSMNYANKIFSIEEGKMTCLNTNL